MATLRWGPNVLGQTSASPAVDATFRLDTAAEGVRLTWRSVGYPAQGASDITAPAGDEVTVKAAVPIPSLAADPDALLRLGLVDQAGAELWSGYYRAAPGPDGYISLGPVTEDAAGPVFAAAPPAPPAAAADPAPAVRPAQPAPASKGLWATIKSWFGS